MERLTDRYKGTAYIKGFQCQLPGIGIEKFNEAVEKLADYEDKEIVKTEIDQIEQIVHNQTEKSLYNLTKGPLGAILDDDISRFNNA